MSDHTDQAAPMDGGNYSTPLRGRRMAQRYPGPQAVVMLIGELFSGVMESEENLELREQDLAETERELGHALTDRAHSYRRVGELQDAIRVMEERFPEVTHAAGRESRALGRIVHKMRGIIFYYADTIATLAVAEGKGLSTANHNLQAVAAELGWIYIHSSQAVKCPVCDGVGKVTSNGPIVGCRACYGRKVINPEHAEVVSRVHSSGYWITDADREPGD